MIDIISAVKSQLGEHLPYSKVTTPDGKIAIYFNTHFIESVSNAMYSGCLDGMGQSEKTFWLKFVKYQQDVQDGTRDDVVYSTLTGQSKEVEAALTTLDKWLSDELLGLNTDAQTCTIN